MLRPVIRNRRKGYPREEYDVFHAPKRVGSDNGKHAGQDEYADPWLSDVLSPHDGTILRAGFFNPAAGHGVDIKWREGDTWWLFRAMHLRLALPVKAGDIVLAGERIGQIAPKSPGGRNTSPNEDLAPVNSPHTHVELRRGKMEPTPSSPYFWGTPVDPRDYGLMSDAPPSLPSSGWPNVLRPGDRHPRVRFLRGVLYGWGYLLANYPVGADRYTLAVEKAVRAFQKDARLTVDGKVGPNTRSALYQRLAASE